LGVKAYIVRQKEAGRSVCSDVGIGDAHLLIKIQSISVKKKKLKCRKSFARRGELVKLFFHYEAFTQ
jgi:hypothetical protein